MSWQRASILTLVLGVLVVLGGCSGTFCCDDVSEANYDYRRDVTSSWCRKCTCFWPPEGKNLDEGEVALTPTWNRIFNCGDQCEGYYYTRGPADCLCGREGGGRYKDR